VIQSKNGDQRSIKYLPAGIIRKICSGFVICLTDFPLAAINGKNGESG
jgi:hypothetical protein